MTEKIIVDPFTFKDESDKERTRFRQYLLRKGIFEMLNSELGENNES